MRIVVVFLKAGAVLGALVGIFLMFGKVAPIAESGRKPDFVLWYWGWIPVMAIFGAIIGAVLGGLAAAIATVSRPKT